MYKSNGLDKFEYHRVIDKKFTHNDAYVSYRVENFHVHTGYMYDPSGRKSGYSFGINKRGWKCSGEGLLVDNYHIGKADE